MKSVIKNPSLDPLALFDGCMTLGSMVLSSVPKPVLPETVDELMVRYHIKEAIVHESHARLVNPGEHGNRRLMEMIKGNPKLHPQWILDPLSFHDQQEIKETVDEMLQLGVTSVRFLFKRVPPSLWLWSDLLEPLAEHHFLCFMDFGNETAIGEVITEELNAVRDIAIAFPDLNLVFSFVMGGLGIHPGILPLMKKIDNLYIDTLGILEYWRKAAREISPERVLFSSGIPFKDPGMFVSDIQYAVDFDENDKKLMCGENLRTLLEVVK